MKTITLFTEEVIVASGNVVSGIVNLRREADDGVFSVGVIVAGDGTGKFEYLVSSDGDNFVVPTGASDIVTAFTKTSGTGGIDMITFAPVLAPYLKIKCSETSTTDSITVTGVLVVR